PDLPPTPANRQLIARVVRVVRAMVDGEFPGIAFDTGAGTDVVRVRRISGTVNRRNPSPTATHPWRLCQLVVESDTEPVTVDMLMDLAAQAPQEAPSSSARTGEITLTNEERDALVRALAPAWRDGQRHNAGVAASGFLYHLGASLPQAKTIITRLAKDDNQPDDRTKALEDTYTRAAEGANVAWFDALKNMLTELEFTRLRQLKRTIHAAHGPALGKQRRDDEKPAKPAAATPDFPLTDTGNAERLVARHGANIRFNYSRGIWHVWTDSYWGEDTAGQMDQLAKDTVRSIPQEAVGLEGEAYTRRLKFAASSESSGKRAAMIELARSEPGIPVLADALDANPWLLNVANGTLDLLTGNLQPHDRADLITRCLRTPYDRDATCPTFLAFLERIFAGNAELISYVQRMFGYALTGSIREQAIFIAFGNGSNGKSTLLGAIANMLEQYATEADTDSFLERQGERIREDCAALDGARFVSASETADGKRLSEAFVKKATGGEKLRARRLFENGYTFLPTCKVWLSTNHRPQIAGTDLAIWRRIRLIPFTVTIPDNERDRDLPAKLEAELPGILAWAVEGCRQWLSMGEQPPPAVLQATAQYRRDSDALANWLEDRCELKAEAREQARELYSDYLGYCDRSGEESLKQRTFGTRLTERGFGETRTGAARFRTGIRLINPERPNQASFDDES
ncbi:MAG: DNA primase family protein, partial [Thermomicrobiales bacterium]